MNKVHTVLAFPYNGDLTAPYLVEIAYPFFDEIVIIEARETLSGNKKPKLYYKQNASKFRKFKDKITVLLIEAFPARPAHWEPYIGMPQEEKDSWFREFYQRDLVQVYLSQKHAKYILCCCDADEIPHPQHLQNLRERYTQFNEPNFLGMMVLYYNADWAVKDAEWTLPFICNDKCTKKLHAIRIGERNAPKIILPNGGWHCTFFFSIDDIIRKLESFSHREVDRACIKDPKYIKDCIQTGKDILSPLRLESFRGDTTLIRYRAPLPESLRHLHEEVVHAQKK
jgi:hypothetical protein